MATICQWSETRSYGEVTFRIEKLDNEAIEVQNHTADGWLTMESFSKVRLMAQVLEKLGTLAASRMTSVPIEGEQDDG